MWVLDYLDDIESDMSAIHRVDYGSMLDLPSPQFFAMARRLPAYQGAMAARLENDKQEGSGNSDNTRPIASPKQQRDKVRMVDGSTSAVKASALADYIDFTGPAQKTA
jgi:hypothetical protein